MRTQLPQRVTKRQHHILDFLVRNYIAHGHPVASEYLCRHADLQVSSATIRSELSQLAQADFLTQTYPSGGRLPTELAYRYFVDHCLEAGAADTRKSSRQERSVSAERLARRLARRLPLLVTVRTNGASPRTIARGATQLFSQLSEQEYASLLGNIGYLLDHLEEIATAYQHTRKTNLLVDVFIGSENPVPALRTFAVFCSRAFIKDVTVLSVGPMRTDYERTLAVMESFVAAL